MKQSCVAIAVILAAFAGGSVPGAVPARADAFSDQVLATVNTARAHYGGPALTWSSALYPATLQYAKACKFAPSDAQRRYGETLYFGVGAAGIADAVRDWLGEAAKYNYDNPGFSQDTGGFTQLVWKSTTQIAVGIASCPAGTVRPQPSTLVVARFTPPGNYLDQFPQNVGRPR